jgi:3',5'-cyclic AMP phosphodiesterase CpdA
LHWGGYLAGDPPADPERAAFPFLRRRGPLMLIGLSTAVPTGPFMAWGKLGDDQLARLGGILHETADERRFRVILLHHPPVRAKGDRFKHLIDASEFREVLRQHGADLVLHGHSHVRSLVWLEGPRQSIPVLGVPSASAAGGRHHPAGYNLLAVEPDGDRWRCDVIERALGGDGAITERARQSLYPRPA